MHYHKVVSLLVLVGMVILSGLIGCCRKSNQIALISLHEETLAPNDGAGTVSCQVNSSDGAPSSGVLIFLHPANGNASASYTMVTDTTGKAILHSLPQGNYVLSIEAGCWTVCGIPEYEGLKFSHEIALPPDRMVSLAFIYDCDSYTDYSL